MKWPAETSQSRVMKITGKPRAAVSRWFKAGEIPDEFAGMFATGSAIESQDPPKPTPVVEAPRTAGGHWLPVSLAVVALLLGLNVYLQLRPPSVDSGGPVPVVVVNDQELARQAGLRYLDLCCTEVIDKLSAANDGDLTAKETLRIIELAIPVIQKRTWSPVTDRLTQLQNDKGVMDQAKLKAALDEVRKGLQSCR